MRLASGVDGLAEVRAFVRRAVAELGGSKRTEEDLVQAVDEATCNVILHGYAGKPGEIEIDAARRGASIEIRILDRAPTFDPTTADVDGARRAGPRRPGTMGVGIKLARTMTDAVRHHVRPDGGNELTLVRSIDAGPEED
jgi:anti-sigma regulatory factor (Ser/Thr protein kinase)